MRPTHFGPVRLSTAAELPESKRPIGLFNQRVQKTHIVRRSEITNFTRIHICNYILGKTKRQLNGSQNRIRRGRILFVKTPCLLRRKEQHMQRLSHYNGWAWRIFFYQ